MRHCYKVIALFLSLALSLSLITPSAIVFADNTIVFNENFENYDTTSAISLIQSNSSGWTRVNALEPTFNATIEKVNNNNLLKMKIDGTGTVNAHQKMRKEIKPEGVNGIVTYKFKVMFPSGIANTSGGTYNSNSGDMQINLDDTNGTEMVALYFTPISNTNTFEVKFCGTDDNPSSSNYKNDLAVTVSSAGNRPSFDRWVDATVSVDTNTKYFTFTMTDNNSFNYTTPKQYMCRNALKISSFTGIPRYVSAYYFRTTSNKMVYIDDISIEQYLDPNIALLAEDKAALTTGLSDINNVKEDFYLPIVGPINGSTVTWTSTSPAVTIASDGYVAVNQTESIQTADLKATLTLGAFTDTKTFTIKIAPMSKEIKALTVSTPTYTKKVGNSTVSVPAPEAGFIITSITVQNTNLVSYGSICLIVASVDKATGKILNINTDNKPIEAGTKFITLSAGTDFGGSPSYEYKYYVWNNTNAPIINCAPAAVKNLTAIGKTKTITLGWIAADDDFQAIKEYSILRNGVELMRTPAVTFIDDTVIPGETYNYSVTAYDHESSASQTTEITASAVNPLYVRLIGTEQAEVNSNSNGITFLVNNIKTSGDSYSEATEKNGLKCRKTVNRSDIGMSMTYLYFTANKDRLSSNDRNVTLEITYFDEGIGDLNIQYNAVVPDGKDPASDNIAKQVLVATRTDSKQWKTAVLNITDAQFRAPVKLTNSDFRLTGSGEIYISSVTAIQTEKY